MIGQETDVSSEVGDVTVPSFDSQGSDPFAPFIPNRPRYDSNAKLDVSPALTNPSSVVIEGALAEVVERNIETLEPEEIEYLEAAGLVEVVSSRLYQDELHHVLRMDEVAARLEKSKAKYKEMNEKIDEAQRLLERDINSATHRFLSFNWLGSDQVEREEHALKALGRVKEYLETEEGYIRLTEQGKHAYSELSIRQERLKGVPYDKFQSELQEFEEKLSAQMDRFEEFISALGEIGFDTQDSEVIRFGLSLSVTPGSVEDVLKRATVYNDWLYSDGWDEYKRLGVAAALTRKNGATYEVTSELNEVFGIMVTDDHEASYGTLLEASAIMDIPGRSVVEKYQRFVDAHQRLSEIGWEFGDGATCFIAAKVAASSGAPKALADAHRGFELDLVKDGIEDSLESGLAATVLFGATAEQAKLARSFFKTRDAMKRYGWSGDRDEYLPAAMLALMPGGIEENVKYTDNIYAELKQKGYSENLTTQAALLLGGVYRSILEQGTLPNLMSYGNYTAALNQALNESDDYSSMNTVMIAAFAAAVASS